MTDSFPLSDVGVLLVNLGTPDAPDPPAVRKFLAEFLSDPRVVEIPPALWKPVLYGVILRTRPAKTAEAYRKIWTNEGSPLMAISKRQAAALRERFGESICIGLAMRYGSGSIGYAISKMVDHGFNRILVAPLYPQYCGATTASVMDAVTAQLRSMRSQPAIRTLPPYYSAPEYVAALSDSIAAGVAALPFKPDVVLTSYHGMPIEYLVKGDPYYCDCLVTTRLVRERLGWSEDFLKVTFQSRFGPDEWLKPYTDKTLEELGQQKKKVALVAPAFSADCIETLEELAITGREQFVHAGGGHDDYAYIPCLNDSDGGMTMLESVVRRELGGWI